MKNPFENKAVSNYSEFLRNQLTEKKSGDVFYIETDKHEKSISSIRATLSYVFNKKVITKVDAEDKNILWVKVI